MFPETQILDEKQKVTSFRSLSSKDGSNEAG